MFNLYGFAEEHGLEVYPSVYTYNVCIESATLYYNPRLENDRLAQLCKDALEKRGGQ